MGIKHYFTNIRKAVMNTATYIPWDTLSGSPGIDWNSQLTVEKAKRCSTVFSCTRLLSDTIAQLPLKLNWKDENGDSSPATSDPLYTVLDWVPNKWQTAFDYWKWNMDCMLYRGWFISLKLLSRNRKVVGLMPLHPDSVIIKQNQDGSLVFSGKGIIGPNKTVNLDNIQQDQAFFCMYATSDGVTPVSPITYNAETIGLALSATDHGSNFLRNDQTPPLVIEYPKKVDKESLKLIAQDWAKKSSGKNAGLPRVVEAGSKVSKLSISNQDAQYLELRQFEKEEICGIFGVPTHMISDTKQAKGWSTVEMQGIEFVTYSVNPFVVRIEQAIRRDLIPRGEWKKKEAKFNTKALMRGDSKARALYMKELRLMGMLSANEGRSLEDMNLRKDPAADEYWIPTNITIDDGSEPEKKENSNEQVQND